MVSLFVNAQYAAPIGTILIDINHLQPTSPIQLENFTAVGIANEAIKYSIPKSMDIRFYCIWCIINQDQFIVYWKSRKDNLGDYTTEHHYPAHCIMARPVYLNETEGSKIMIQGCVNYAIRAHTACMLSPSFGHKTCTTPVLSPSYRNSARTTCMLSPQFGHIISTVGRYIRHSA